MKFLFATDTHLKGRNPSSRTDDFPRAMLLKLEELCYVGQRMNVAAILHGGDLFDVPDVANTMIGEVATIIRKYGVLFYVVPGNHDLYGYQIKSLPQTALGVLEKAGVVKLLTRDSGPEDFVDGTVKVAVQGQEYYADIDKGNPQDYEFPSWVQADHKILIPHSMLVPKEFFPGVPCTLTKDVNTLADLIMVGHYHPGFDDHTIGSTRFINPGSMGRLDATKGSMSRIPGYLILDAQANQAISVTFKEFKTAKPGPSVLDSSHLQAQASRQVQISNLQQSVATVRQVVHTDINSILLNLATQQSQPIEVIRLAKDAIVKADQDDKATTATDGFIELNQPTWIRCIELENFQSHEDTVIDLEPGLNAIVGQSDSGKTAIMRALRWVAYNEPKGAEFIRHGANETRVRITMDTGAWVERGRSRKASGYYHVGHTEPDGTQVMDLKFEGFGNDIPIEVQNVLQMPKSNLGRGDAETLSMSYQLNAPFLISESASMKASVIGRLTGVHLLDTAIAGINGDHLRTKKSLTTADAQLKEHEEKLKDFDDLPALEQAVNQLDTLITEYEAYEQRSDELMQIRSEIQRSIVDIATVQQELDQFAHVKTARARMDKIEAAMGTYQQLKQVATDMHESTEEIQQLEADLTRYAGLAKAQKGLAKIDAAMVTYKELLQIQKERAAALNEIAAIEKAMQGLPDTKALTAMVKELEDAQSTHQALVSIQAERISTSDLISRLKLELDEVQDDRKDAETILASLLSRVDVCPFCNRPMENHKEEIHHA